MKILAAVLFLAAAPSPARAQGDGEIVRVNGTPIRQSEVLERLWKRYGPETLEEMIDELLLRQAAQARKVQTSTGEVDKRLSRLRARFPDDKLFQSQLERSGTSMEGLKTDLAEQIAREKLLVKERGLSVKDEEVKKSFQERRDDLGTPKAVHLRHILVAEEAQAREIAEKVRGGGDFKALAKERSLAPTGKVNGGDYGFVSQGMLPPEIDRIAFSMADGELKVVPSERGFHILQALAKKAAVPAEYAKVKDELKDLLLQEKVNRALPDYLKELRRKAEIKPQGR